MVWCLKPCGTWLESCNFEVVFCFYEIMVLCITGLLISIVYCFVAHQFLIQNYVEVWAIKALLKRKKQVHWREWLSDRVEDVIIWTSFNPECCWYYSVSLMHECIRIICRLSLLDSSVWWYFNINLVKTLSSCHWWCLSRLKWCLVMCVPGWKWKMRNVSFMFWKNLTSYYYLAWLAFTSLYLVTVIFEIFILFYFLVIIIIFFNPELISSWSCCLLASRDSAGSGWYVPNLGTLSSVNWAAETQIFLYKVFW